MKCVAVIIFSLWVGLANAGDTASRIPIPMRNGMIFYEKAFPVKGDKPKIPGKVVKWFKDNFSNRESALKKMDAMYAAFTGEAAFKIVVNTNGNYYWVRPIINITITADSCIFNASHYYEKPIEKGITNDYSKIEYRWWDYRQGKPWSAEDTLLFEGLHQQTLDTMASLEKSINE